MTYPAYSRRTDLSALRSRETGALAPTLPSKLPDGTLVGTNGYALMTIQGSTLSLEYLDADQTSVLNETFVPSGGAAWDGTLVRTVVRDPQILNQMIYEQVMAIRSPDGGRSSLDRTPSMTAAVSL